MRQKPFVWYHLRLTFETAEQLDEEAKKLEKKMLAISSQYAAVKELSKKEKPHIHMNYLSNLSTSKLRDYLIPKGLGRMDKYFKEIQKIDETDCYICKGDSSESPIMESVLFHSKVKYTTNYLEECHKQFWELYAKLQLTKRTKALSFVDLVVAQLRREFENKIWKSTDASHRRIVLSCILDNLGNKGKGFDVMILRRLMNGILNILDPFGMKGFMETLIFDYQERENLGMDV